MLQCKTSEAPTTPGAGTLDLEGAATARTGVFSALKLGTQHRKPPSFHSPKLLIQSSTRTQRGSPSSSLQGLQDFTGPYTQAVLRPTIPQRSPSPAVYPTLTQGTQSRAEIALSQPVQAQGWCVPNIDPCPLPACFSSPRRCKGDDASPA